MDADDEPPVLELSVSCRINLELKLFYEYFIRLQIIVYTNYYVLVSSVRPYVAISCYS